MISGDIRYPKFNVYIPIFLWLLCPCVPFWFFWLAIPSCYTKSSFLLDHHQISCRQCCECHPWHPSHQRSRGTSSPWGTSSCWSGSSSCWGFSEVFEGHVGHMWGCEILAGDVGGLFRKPLFKRNSVIPRPGWLMESKEPRIIFTVSQLEWIFFPWKFKGFIHSLRIWFPLRFWGQNRWLVDTKR